MNLSQKFRPDPSTFYLVIVVTNKQTDRQNNADDYIIPRESFRGDNNDGKYSCDLSSNGFDLFRPVDRVSSNSSVQSAEYTNWDGFFPYCVLLLILILHCVQMGAQLFLQCFDTVGWAAGRASGL